jgi:hypothetical protein
MKSKILLFLFCFLSLTLNNFAQENQFPNELEGFQFFKNEKIGNLKLLVSTKEDVKAVMGENCANGCDYDGNWKISFAYVGSQWYRKSSQNGIERLYKPKAEFVGKLHDINFYPKRQIILPESIQFPKGFRCNNGTTKREDTKYNERVCIDSSRIIYAISNENTSDGKILKEQIMHIGYLSSQKDNDGIFALVEN